MTENTRSQVNTKHKVHTKLTVFLSPGPVCHLIPELFLSDHVRYSSRQDVLSAGVPSLQPPGLCGLKQGSLQEADTLPGNVNNTVLLILK